MKEASHGNAKEPRFLTAARTRANQKGLSLDAFLTETRELAEKPSFPTMQCLYPEEADKLLRRDRELSRSERDEGTVRARMAEEFPDEMGHVSQCAFCQSM